MTIQWIRICKFIEITGETDDSTRANMQRHWPEGVVWVKAPNGTIHIHVENYNKWVEGKIKKGEQSE